MNLSRAFLYAGASSVVVSLWSATESTTPLMEAFYRRMAEGATKAEALRAAKEEMIRKRVRLDASHELSLANPFLWAPFVLVGAPE